MNICPEYEKESLGHEITAFRPATGADPADNCREQEKSWLRNIQKCGSFANFTRAATIDGQGK